MMNSKQSLALAAIPLVLAACATVGEGDTAGKLPAVETSAARGVAIDIDLRRDDGVLMAK